MKCFITRAQYCQKFVFRERLLQIAMGLVRVDKTRIPRLHVDTNMVTGPNCKVFSVCTRRDGGSNVYDGTE
jgi:hypothetical protein